MDTKHLIWILPITLALGIIIGLFILPKEYTFEIKQDTRDWLDRGGYIRPLLNLTSMMQNITNLCCYPIDCPQSARNPELCTCEYMVKCFNTDK
jgi:hypothetical protein